MKKICSIILVFALLFPLFMPLSKIKATTNEYKVVSIKSDGSTTDIGIFNDYESAKKAADNYNSTLDDVAGIKENNKLVYVKYGIFRLDDSEVIVTFSTEYGSRYISPPYNTDTLFLDYDPNSNKVKIMISGAIGWIDANKGIVNPYSFITSGNSMSYDPNSKYVKILYKNGIRLREGPGVEYNQVGCNGAYTCATTQGAILAYAGEIYEWLNPGSVTNDGKNDWYQIKVKGNIGYVANEVATRDLEEYDVVLGSRQTLQTYYYVNDAGELYHKYYFSNGSVANTRLGKAPLYLNKNVSYYSFDGNYFYNDFSKLVNDLRNGNYNNAVNKLPYYNYYEYLPVRTRTTYNAANLNEYIGFNSKINRSDFYELKYNEEKKAYKWTSYGDWDTFPKGQSMLYGEGESFINSQEKYGINAATTLSLAITESGWGRSYMSVREYNIFGHGAYDTAPDEYAASYESIAASINAHAYKYLALDYANPIDGYNYNGSHYGNKLSGNNVRYASDAYWGEKMASNYYSIDKTYGFQDFLQRKTLGMKQIASAVPVYSDSTTKSIKYYDLKSTPNIPVTILEEVDGEEINGNNKWYKIQSDVPIGEDRKLVPLTNQIYNFDTSYAYVHSSYIYKESKEPNIYANNIEIYGGTDFNPLNGVTAYDAFDGDVTSKIKVIKNDVNIKQAGIYDVVYEAMDSENNRAEKTIKVTVLSSKPTINASDRIIQIDSEFNPLSEVTANDFSGNDITGNIKVKYNNVNVSAIGEYEVVYSVNDGNNNTNEKSIKVIVQSSIPVITAANRTLNIDDVFDPMFEVSANDIEDGNITNSIKIVSNDVDTNIAGTYNVTYEVTDSHNNSVTKTINVTVNNPNYKETDNIYYFDSLNIINNKLHLKGFLTLSRVNNTLDNNIKYQLVYTNELDGTMIYQKLNRITNKDNMPFMIESESGFDYTYSWFEGDIDISKLQNGNYTLSIEAHDNEFITSVPLSNVFGANMVSTYVVDQKSVLIRNNFESRNAAIQFFVRDSLLSDKNAKSDYNMYNDYSTIKFIDNNLIIRGTSHIIGGDYGINTDVKRTLTFENISNFERFTYDIGSITNGDYIIELRVSDGFDKTKGWFETNIDVSNLPIGTYTLNVATSSNLSDFGELQDIFDRTIDVTTVINNKKYSFKTNEDKRYRIELNVENA